MKMMFLRRAAASVLVASVLGSVALPAASAAESAPSPAVGSVAAPPVASVVAGVLASIGGTTWGDGSGTGGSGGGTGVTVTPGSGSWIPGGLADPSTLGNVPWYDYFTVDTTGCGADAIGQIIRYDRKIVGGRYVDTFVSRECKYPATYRLQTVMGACVREAEAAIAMTAPTAKSVYNQRKVSDWGKATGPDKTLALCDASKHMKLSVNKTMTQFGQYKATGTTWLDNIEKRVYTGVDPRTGKIPPPTLVGWERGAQVNSFNTRGTLNCDGWFNDLRAYNQACTAFETPKTPPVVGVPVGTPEDAPYQCVVDRNSGKLDGKTEDIVDIMRDGKKHSLTWAAPKVTGLASVTPKATSFQVWNAPKKDTGEVNKPWTVDMRIGTTSILPTTSDTRKASTEMFTTKKVSGIKTALDLKVFKSTTRDEPMMITPVYEFTGKFTSTSTKITGFDFATNKVTTEKVTITTDQTATCLGDTVSTNAMKAMNDVM